MKELLVVLFVALPYIALMWHLLKQSIKAPVEQEGHQFEELSTAIVQKFLSVDEMKLARKYAVIFGLDSEEFDIDFTAVLEMGQKCESYLGSDKLEEIHDAIVQEVMNRYFYRNSESKGIHHQINMMIKSNDLVATPVFIAVVTKTLTGGNKDAEPSISSYAAA